MAPTHVLLESASGYAVFQSKLYEEIGSRTGEVQKSINDFAKFSKMVTLISFLPFKSAAHALENANDISEGILNDHLRSLLEMVLTQSSAKNKIVLAVADKTLATSIKTALGIQCEIDEGLDLIRGVRLHADRLLKGLEAGDIEKAQLGLGHSYSRAKIKFNVNRSDNMIIQAIALLDQLDKDVNTFAMRVREWYGYHFPELVRLVADNHQYARAAKFIGSKDTLTEEKLPDLIEIVGNDEVVAKNILDAARTSMGGELSDVDMINISMFAERVISLAEYRKSLTAYLAEKMNQVAPSLTALIGERIGARLISHAGSLTNLSKYPASTVQILGAEKALFRALKTKGNTPKACKYGLIYHSSFIGKAGPKFKGRISRFLANKLSIASRIDCFADTPSAKFGEALREQVEERLNFFENSDTMRKVLEALADEQGSDEEMAPAVPVKSKEKKSKEGKRKHKELEDAMEVDGGAEEQPVKKKKKKSKEDKGESREQKDKEKRREKEKHVDVFDEPVAEKKKKKKRVE
ncbi:Nucleolar protein 56 AltName: Full=Ribosome biosynthesis protein sik1 [Serendipita indica DSM 11827]|nr:Nucleolar protein 56 AltName: Full=Ribosome biosynthesis protein sik1 [Serendipita indica DSM 11827]